MVNVAKRRQESLLDLAQHWLFVYWVIIQVVSWWVPNAQLSFVQSQRCYYRFANSMVYYGLTMAAGNLYPDNLYASVMFSGLAEIPAYGLLLCLQVRLLLRFCILH